MSEKNHIEAFGDGNTEELRVKRGRIVNAFLSDSLGKTFGKDLSLYLDSSSYLTDTLFLTPVDFFISFEKDSLKKSWFDYLAWLTILRDSPHSEGAIVAADFITGDKSSQLTGKSGVFNNDSLNIVSKEKFDPRSSNTNTEIPKLNSELDHLERTTSDKYSRFPYYFVVQVAASETLLDSIELRRKYNGPFEIRKTEEEGWYKYQIGVSGNYLEALQVWKSVSTDGSFLVAYNADGEKLKLWKAILTQKQNLIRFRVQIAASITPLSDREILDFYNGDMNILETEEEGWFKYQIDVGNDYQEARKKEQLINIEGAFIVPYLGDEKLPLYNMLRFYRF